MKLYYFDIFGRAEPIRMVFAKAGVQYEDCRVTGQSWDDLKMSGKCEFGQVPILELDDGTILSQSFSIAKYVAAKHGLIPTDLMAVYKGEKAAQHTMEDFMAKKLFPVMFAPEDKQNELASTLLSTDMPAFFKSFSDCCLGDTKFLCGDTTTVFDFICAGFFVNMVLNPNAKMYEATKQCFDDNANDKLKKYIADFREDMKDYLTARETHICTM